MKTSETAFARWTGVFLVAIGCVVVAERGTRANVINMSDQTIAGGDADKFENIGETLDNTGDIFLKMDVTVSGNGGVLDTANTFFVADLAAGAANKYGAAQRFDTNLWALLEEGCCGSNSSETVAVGTTTVVMKVDHAADLMSLWINPNLNAEESAADHTFGFTDLNPSLNRVVYRIGSTHDNTVAFTNVMVFDEGSSPFVPTAPEPSTFILAALSIVGLCMRRRRRERA